MSDLNRVSSDLDYVRSAIRRAEGAGPPSIYYVWSVLVLVGFTLVDLRPRVVGFYWALAGPLGGLITFLLAWRWSRHVGQASRREGMLHAIHWYGFMACVLLLVPMISAGQLREDAIARVILLFTGLAYLTAGNYLDRRLRWVALVVFGCYALTFLLQAYPWTISGVILAVCLVMAGLLGGRGGAAAS